MEIHIIHKGSNFSVVKKGSTKSMKNATTKVSAIAFAKKLVDWTEIIIHDAAGSVERTIKPGDVKDVERTTVIDSFSLSPDIIKKVRDFALMNDVTKSKAAEKLMRLGLKCTETANLTKTIELIDETKDEMDALAMEHNQASFGSVNEAIEQIDSDKYKVKPIIKLDSFIYTITKGKSEDSYVLTRMDCGQDVPVADDDYMVLGTIEYLENLLTEKGCTKTDDESSDNVISIWM